jgi:hypothetical protein
MLSRHLRALTLQSLSLSLSLSLFLLLSHLVALLLVFRLAHWPLWAAPLLLLALCLPQLLLRRFTVEALAPLFALYALAALRLFIVYALRQNVPDALNYAWGLLISLVWIGLIYLRIVRRLQWIWMLMGMGAAVLMGCLLWINRPAGVTGSDPLAYVLMGIDLATRGTPRHYFPLAPLAENLGLPTLPTTHVGYVLPNAQGLAPTVWPPGYSVLLAIAYRLAGHTGMMSVNTFLGMLNLALTFALTLLVLPRGWRHIPRAVGAGALVLLATSLEQYTRLGVPLADGAAQAFTTLAVFVTFRASRFASTRLLFIGGLLAGLALALAFSIRYTQLLIAPGIAFINLLGFRDWRKRFAFLFPCGLAAVAGALPDLLYRAQLYGSPFRFGTGELALFSLSALPTAAQNLSAELLSPNEFGWFWPFILIGAIYLWRRNRMTCFGLATCCLPLLIFHLWYPFAKLRDVLALYAPLTVLGALGVAVVFVWLWRRGTLARLLALLSLFALFTPRVMMVWGLTQGFFTFGYLYPEQRQAIESLTALTEPEAVIACSLNSGAVEVYAHRAAVRPGDQLQPLASWDESQWLAFVAALRAQGRPIYLLMDSPEMDAPLAALQARYTVTPIAHLPVPVFSVGGGARNLIAPLYRLNP